MSVLMSARGLEKTFPWRGRRLQALAGVDLEVHEGECLAVVGESGSGKTTLAHCLLRLTEADAGEVLFSGTDLLALKAKELRRRRREFQMVFQGVSDSFDPRQRVRQILAEPLAIHRLARRDEMAERVAGLLARVGLAESLAARYPHQLSGGQRQRVGIARALATEPRLLVLDEPVSALDVSVQAQILRLLQGLQRELALTLVLISHDLAVVEQIADRVAVFYLGRIVEQGPRREVLRYPKHPYTAALLESVPVPEPRRERRVRQVQGEPPSPLDPPSGCPFHPRCQVVGADVPEICRGRLPTLQTLGEEHLSACHFPLPEGRTSVAPEPVEP